MAATINNPDFGPDHEGVIDAFTSAIYEMEAFNHFAHEYAMATLHYYHGDFSDFWYSDWIATEEFRGGKYPDGRQMPRSAKLRYEQMFDMYWDARAEWFNVMIANLNRKNINEQNRMMFLHRLTDNQSWDEFGKAARFAPRITHTLDDYDDYDEED